VAGNDLILEEGLLSKNRTNLNIPAVRTVNIYQSFFNRMLRVGLKDAAVMAFIVSIIVLVIFAFAAGDGFIGEI